MPHVEFIIITTKNLNALQMVLSVYDQIDKKK